MTFQLVDLTENHLAQAVRIWEGGWHDAHARIVPRELAELRTPASFLTRLRDNIATARVGISGGDVLGLCIIRGDELYQMYVAAGARGQGLAQLLMADAERRLLGAGHASAWLACAVGNDRAARFYEKSGWSNAGVRTVELDTPDGLFPLQVWRFEKTLV